MKIIHTFDIAELREAAKYFGGDADTVAPPYAREIAEQCITESINTRMGGFTPSAPHSFMEDIREYAEHKGWRKGTEALLKVLEKVI